MANDNSRPIISMNGILAAVLLLALLLWGFRMIILQDLGVAGHGQPAEEHAAAEAVTMEAPAEEAPAAPMMQVVDVADAQGNFAPSDYVAFDQGAYQQLAAAGVNWQANYQAPDFDAARSTQPVMAPVQVADSSSSSEGSEGGDEAAVVGDAEAGAKIVKKKCGSCHSFDEGGKHKTGPNLWGVVGRQSGSADGYTKYSNDLKDWGQAWDAEGLNTFLTKPKAMFKKTRMAFAGFKKEQDRADVIAYLETLKAAE